MSLLTFLTLLNFCDVNFRTKFNKTNTLGERKTGKMEIK